MLTLLIGTVRFFLGKRGLSRAVSRIVGLLAMIRGAFDEMQEMRRAAHKRHPFIEM